MSLLPDILEEDGVAYLMQISVLGQLRTVELLERSGFGCKVIDFSLFHFGPVFQENIEQIGASTLFAEILSRTKRLPYFV